MTLTDGERYAVFEVSDGGKYPIVYNLVPLGFETLVGLQRGGDGDYFRRGVACSDRKEATDKVKALQEYWETMWDYPRIEHHRTTNRKIVKHVYGLTRTEVVRWAIKFKWKEAAPYDLLAVEEPDRNRFFRAQVVPKALPDGRLRVLNSPAYNGKFVVAYEVRTVVHRVSDRVVVADAQWFGHSRAEVGVWWYVRQEPFDGSPFVKVTARHPEVTRALKLYANGLKAMGQLK